MLLLVGLIHGLIYVTIMPPWQHYEEPVHFEFAWMIAERGRIPNPDEYNQNLRREIAASMIENDFFVNMGRPNLLTPAPWIGIPQTEDAPLYHIIISLPLIFLKYTAVELQMYVGRVVSLTMYLGTILVAYAITGELTQENNPLRWLIPLFISLIPAFTDLMTAINNDVGATLIFSLFLWAGVRLLLRGFTIWRAASLILAATLSLFTKNTVLVAVPLAGLCFLFLAALKSHPTWRKAALPTFLVFLLVGVALIFSFRDAAFWYRRKPTRQQYIPTRTKQVDAPLGEAAIEIRFEPAEEKSLTLFQPLTSENVAQLRGAKATLGAWIWASEPLEIRTPYLWIDGSFTPQLIQITTKPTFIVQTEFIPDDAESILLVLTPLQSGFDRPVSIYYDGLVLTRGEFAPGEPPSFFSPTGEDGEWGGRNFANLLRNPSAEKTWLTIKPAVLQSLSSRSAISPYALPAMQDTQMTSALYRRTIRNLFQSFWARFAWNQIALPVSWYSSLALLTATGVLGAVAGGYKRWKTKCLRWKFAVSWFTLAAGLVWLAALVRQNLPFWGLNLFIPGARYAYPAIIPTTFILAGGWATIANFSKYRRVVWGLLLALFLVLDVYSIVTIVEYYRVIGK